MPTYTRHCDKCDEIFDVMCKIADKDSLKPSCPYCDSQAGSWQISAPHFTLRGDRMMHQKKDAGFQEVLSKIKERNPRTAISEI